MKIVNYFKKIFTDDNRLNNSCDPILIYDPEPLMSMVMFLFLAGLMMRFPSEDIKRGYQLSSMTPFATRLFTKIVKRMSFIVVQLCSQRHGPELY